jgi:hypothetical protein
MFLILTIVESAADFLSAFFEMFIGSTSLLCQSQLIMKQLQCIFLVINVIRSTDIWFSLLTWPSLNLKRKIVKTFQFLNINNFENFWKYSYVYTMSLGRYSDRIRAGRSRNRGSDPGRSIEVFLLVQTGSGAYPGSYSMGIKEHSQDASGWGSGCVDPRVIDLGTSYSDVFVLNIELCHFKRL